jgi:hypothetical protein
LWGSKTTTDKGKKIEDFISQEGLCIFNDGTDTYLLQCSSSLRPEDAKIAEVVRCWMFFEPSFGLFAIFCWKKLKAKIIRQTSII